MFGMSMEFPLLKPHYNDIAAILRQTCITLILAILMSGLDLYCFTTLMYFNCHILREGSLYINDSK
jgi:hypothetical protein